MVSLILTALLALSTARADWEAAFTAQSSKGSFPRAAGRFYSKIDEYRIDANTPFDLSLYVKSGSSRVSAAIHSFHIKLSSNFEKFSAQMPACLAKSFDDCVKQIGLKKVREEACGDAVTPQTCEVYVSEKPGMKGVKKIEIRHWKGEKEPILASSVVTKSDGDVITTNFTKISRKAHDEAFYTIPANYQDAGTLEKFFGDFKGKSE